MTTDSIPALLEPIQSRRIVAAAPADVARLLAAVQAVTALHQPDNDGTIGTYCSHCTSLIDGGPELYPCPTVRAVVAALGGEA
ncbi:hypothetical protein [Paenarthrobacter nicotinovorans]|uniref:hypothetical protein n=1 Tax=Paenarthrobacter nicotinovorans TaxID=29320 RepID=UPI0039A64EE2